MDEKEENASDSQVVFPFVGEGECTLSEFCLCLPSRRYEVLFFHFCIYLLLYY